MEQAKQVRRRPGLERKVYERSRKRALIRLGNIHKSEYNQLLQQELAVEAAKAAAGDAR